MPFYEWRSLSATGSVRKHVSKTLCPIYGRIITIDFIKRSIVPEYDLPIVVANADLTLRGNPKDTACLDPQKLTSGRYHSRLSDN